MRKKSQQEFISADTMFLPTQCVGSLDSVMDGKITVKFSLFIASTINQADTSKSNNTHFPVVPFSVEIAGFHSFRSTLVFRIAMQDPVAVHLTFPETDIALVTLDVPERSANMLSSSLLDEISERLDQIESRGGIAGVIFASAKSNSFVVGADLQELRESLDLSDEDCIAFFEKGKRLFQRFASIDAATIAAIHGACVGGGAELSLWCDERVASSDRKTCLGFPEVNLGLIPGWGGTVRAPRLIGLSCAVEMIARGKPVDVDEALTKGLISRIVDKSELVETSIKLVRQNQQTQEFRSRREHLAQPIEVSSKEREQLQSQITAITDSTIVPDSAASETAIRLMLASADEDVPTAMQMESEAMAKLFGSEANRALLNLFFLQDRVRKDAGTDGGNSQPARIRRVGIAGAGLMGQGIAHANLISNISVTLFDIDDDLLGEAKNSLATPESGDLFATSADVQCFSDCDLVIESIVENEPVKQEFLGRVESTLKTDSILSSNTSSISINKLAEKLEKPGRFCGIHFAHPVAERKLLEIVRGANSSDETIATAVCYGKQIGKLPIVVSDSPGFVLNRLLFPYVNESLVLMSEGVPIREIDAAAVEFGMQYGPISHFDRVGLDTAAYTGMTMYRSFSSRTAMTPILPKLVKKKRLGIKSGRGFYSYENEMQTAEDDPTLFDIVGSYIQDPPRSYSRDEIRMRLFLPILVEATMILEEKLVRFPGDIDLSLVFGLAFPKSKGGILFWADRLGPKRILELLEPFSDLGPRYQPTEMMNRMANDDVRYYAW